MAAGDFSTYYGDNPWIGIDKNQRQYWVPSLLTKYRTESVYNQFITHARDLGAVPTKYMTFTRLLDTHPNFNTISPRQLWLRASHFDSEEITISFNRYGSKVAYHEYDSLVNIWKQDPKGGLKQIVNAGLGRNAVNIMDLLGRNAFLSGNYQMYAGTATNFAGLSTSDKMTTDDILDIHLGMINRELPLAVNPVSGEGSIICITTPGVLHDLRLQTGDDWIDRLKYADPKRLLRYEMGSWQNVRFVTTPRAHLYNCGTVLKQCTITSPLAAGSGVAATVDSAWQPGQTAATHYVQLSSFDASDFKINDIVTVHVQRTSAHGVTNGVDYTDGKLHNVRVVAVDADNNQLQFAQPIMEDFTDDLTGGGVYGYVTKGRHIHTSIFLGGGEGIYRGVGREPLLHTPPRMDDFESLYRFSWDAYLGHTVVNPEQFEVFFSAGSYRYKGDRVVQ